MPPSPVQLTPHLWAVQSQVYNTNSGIFVNEGLASLIDPCMLPDEIRAIARFIAEQNAAPQAIVLTHSHWDHIFGPAYFANVRVIAHANYVQEVSGEKGARILRQVKQWEAEYGIDCECPFAIPQPHQTFESSMRLTLGSLELQLIHAPGHATDQLAVYHAGGATLWAADMLSDLEIPFVSHNLAAYEQTLARLSTLEIQILIPGHGNPSAQPAEIRARLSDDTAYLAELRDKISRAIGQGKTLPETLELCENMRYRHPQDNAEPHKMNVESVYIELGGEADPAKFGWRQE